MDYVNLGNTGLKVSRICLGCMTYGSPATGELKARPPAWALNEEESQPFFRQALDLGINFFDTANVYSGGDSEEVLGRFLKANTRRETIVSPPRFTASCATNPTAAASRAKPSCFELDESLRRLQTDYVDLYQIHRWDYETPIEETLEALHDVVKSGKVRYIGASSHVRLAVRQGALSRRPPRLDPLRLHAEPLQPPLSRRGARDDAALPRPKASASFPGALSRAAASPAPGRAKPPSASKPTSSARRCTRRPKRPTAKLWTAWARLPNSAASPAPSSRWPGCSASRRSPRRLSAPPSRTILRTPWRRSRCTSRPKRLPLSKSRTRRIPYLASAKYGMRWPAAFIQLMTFRLATRRRGFRARSPLPWTRRVNVFAALFRRDFCTSVQRRWLRLRCRSGW